MTKQEDALKKLMDAIRYCQSTGLPVHVVSMYGELQASCSIALPDDVHYKDGLLYIMESGLNAAMPLHEGI